MTRSYSLSTAVMVGAFVGAIISIMVVPVLSGAGPPPPPATTTEREVKTATTATTTLPFCHELTTAAFDPCTSNPCATGLCSNQGGSQFRCICTEGWHGTHCDTGFLCGDVDNTCLPFSAVCNNSQECPTYHDEVQCCGGDSGHTHFRCGGTPYCILPNKLCDNDHDCNPFVDESFYCGSTCTITASPVETTTIACITTTLTPTTGSTTSLTTGSGTMIIPTATNAAINGDVEKRFFNNPGTVAAVFTVSGVAVAGATAAAAYLLCKIKDKNAL